MNYRCKERHVVNGNSGKVKYIHDSIIFVQSEKYLLPIFPVYDNQICHYPIVPGYASTVHKIMGQDIPHVTLVFDLKTLSSAVGYVALSRVGSIDNIVPLLRLRKSHFYNV